ncbi:MAG: quinolinate synthase NadA [Phycisphaerales bacterium]|nr:quinolinate synthase NadA [Phycisphaerales bacterium]
MLWQPSLSDHYLRMSPDELGRQINDRRARLGESLVILGHHYQTDDVIRHADFTGDSLKLSQIAARVAGERPVRHVVFCGVHFMAETADMLTPEHVEVILPDLSAGCSMADMADYDDVCEAWDMIHAALRDQGWRGRIIPVTYVNSTAAIKAFVGERGGACCTSSNADRVFEWALAGGDEPDAGDDVKVLFLPDQHLGRNTAAKFGVDVATESCLYDPRKTRQGHPLGGASPGALLEARVILWAGHCSVHKLFRPEHCDEIHAENERRLERGEEPVRILVHPECCKEVVDRADLAGSTEFIIATIRRAPRGSRWAVGTEVHLVGRLSREAAERGVEVRILSDCQCLCTTMYRIDEPHLLWTLDNLCGVGTPRGEARSVNVIRVHPEVRAHALAALERMLRLASEKPVGSCVD